MVIMIGVYFDLIEVLLKQKSNEFELSHEQFIVLFIYGQGDDCCHDLLVPCEIAILVFLLIFDLRDLHDALKKSQQDLSRGFAAVDADLAYKLSDSYAKLFVELEVNETDSALLDIAFNSLQVSTFLLSNPLDRLYYLYLLLFLNKFLLWNDGLGNNSCSCSKERMKLDLVPVISLLI